MLKSYESGKHGTKSVENLDSKSDAIITTVINKFVAAIKKANNRSFLMIFSF